LELKITCALPVADVQKLSPEDQADAAYGLLGWAADALGELGFDPSIIAHVTMDLGNALVELAGQPVPKVVRVPRGSEH
jgi:hypothetical protein